MPASLSRTRAARAEAINLAAAIRYIINEYNNLVGGDGSGDAGLGSEPGGTGTGAAGAAGGGGGGGDAHHRSPQTPITISVSDETHVAEELPPMVAFLGAFYKNAQVWSGDVGGVFCCQLILANHSASLPMPRSPVTSPCRTWPRTCKDRWTDPRPAST